VVVLEVQPCGRWSLVAFCRACGGNAMIGSLRTKKEPLRNSFSFSFILCTLGRLRSSHLYRLVLMISLYCFLLPLRCLSCILPVYLIALFIDISLAYKKKMTILLAVITLDLAHILALLAPVGCIGNWIRVGILLERSLCEKTLFLTK
jgi:hypothetical protein